jgi:hypothetical protein
VLVELANQLEKVRDLLHAERANTDIDNRIAD